VLTSRYFCQLLMKLEVFPTDYLKVLKYQISWKSGQWDPSCSMRTYGQTDVTKLIIAFRNFANAPKSRSSIPGRTVWATQAIECVWGGGAHVKTRTDQSSKTPCSFFNTWIRTEVKKQATRLAMHHSHQKWLDALEYCAYTQTVHCSVNTVNWIHL
jgi:hypothetical protein